MVRYVTTSASAFAPHIVQLLAHGIEDWNCGELLQKNNEIMKPRRIRFNLSQNDCFSSKMTKVIAILKLGVTFQTPCRLSYDRLGNECMDIKRSVPYFLRRDG